MNSNDWWVFFFGFMYGGVMLLYASFVFPKWEKDPDWKTSPELMWASGVCLCLVLLIWPITMTLSFLL